MGQGKKMMRNMQNSIPKTFNGRPARPSDQADSGKPPKHLLQNMQLREIK